MVKSIVFQTVTEGSNPSTRINISLVVPLYFKKKSMFIVN
jgi:hypothetical protein